MTAIVFPSTLPGPSVASVTPAERRLLSDVTGGPQQARGVQRDYLGVQSIEWSLLSATDAAALDLWWRATLTYGGAWFASTWPSPQGWVSAVRRFVGTMKWAHLPGGFWKVTATVQVKGVGLAPNVYLKPLVWNVGVSNSPPWAITGASASLSGYSTSPVLRQTIFGDQYAATGKRYFEIYVNDTSSSDAAHVIGKMGLTQIGFGLHWPAWINGTGTGDSGDGDPAQLGGGANYPTWSSPTTMQFAIDIDAGLMWIGSNGSWGAGSPAPDPAAGIKPGFNGITGPVTPFVRYYAINMTTTLNLRTSTGVLTYAPPSGFIPFGS